MTAPRHIGVDAESSLTWSGAVGAIEHGHRRPAARIDDTLLQRGDDAVLSRSAWIDGLGIAVKTATVFPGNGSVGRATVNGALAMLSDETGELDATVDFHLITKWKTAADSLLAAKRLARPDSERILIVGCGTVGASMVEAYRDGFPRARIHAWNRTARTAHAFANSHGVEVAEDLESAVADADIISTATMSTTPLIRGEWLHPGQHLDLIGGYRPDMREADDACIAAGRLFVDSATTALDVGDVADPIANGVIAAADIVADYTSLDTGEFARHDADEVTIFKNAGGAHLDVMVARYICDATS